MNDAMPPITEATQSPSFAGNRQRWADRLTLDLIEEQLSAVLFNLDDSERARYLELAKLVPQCRHRLSNALASFRQTFEQQALADLREKLLQRTEVALDPLATYLHTYHLQIQADFPHKEEQQLQTRTLWQAALENFGFNVRLQTGSGLDFLRASSINTQPSGGRHNLIPVSTFVEVVRDLDLGERLQRMLSQQLTAQTALPARDYHRAMLQFALLDSYRQSDDDTFNREQLQLLTRGCATPGALQWKYFNLKFPDGLLKSLLAVTPVSPALRELERQLGNLADDRLNRTLLEEQLPLPFYVLKLDEAVFSYLPERPGGPWQRHASLADAVDSLRKQIHLATTAKSLGWLYRWLPLTLQQKLSAFLKTETVDRQQLNWLALWLHDNFARQPSATQMDIVESPNSPWRQLSLLDIISREQQQCIATDLSLMASSNNSADFDTFSKGFLFAVSEVLQLLTLPAPGGVTGLNRAMLAATLGSLGYQTASAGQALLVGHSTEAAQALADIADLLISGRIQNVGAKLSAQRSRQLVGQLGRSPQIASKLATRLDSSQWNSNRLLEHLLPWELQLSAVEITRLLRLSGVARQQLDAAWRSDGDLPWQIQALLEWQRPDQAVSSIDALQERFPGLAPAAAKMAMRRFPQLDQIKADTLLEPELANSLLGLQEESRVLHALQRLENGQLDRDAEAICCQLLTITNDWPAQLGIRIDEDLQSPPGAGFYPAAAVQLYGSPQPERLLTLTRVGNLYLDHDNQPVTLLQALIDHEPSIAGAYHDTVTLGEHLLTIALRNRDSLTDLLAESPLQAVTPQRLTLKPTSLPDDVQIEDGATLVTVVDKTYALIESTAYSAYLDPQTSTTQQPVWRLSDRQEPANPGTAIIEYRQRWYYHRLPGAGGMPRRLDALREKNRQAAQAERDAQALREQQLQEQLTDINRKLRGFAQQLEVANSQVTSAADKVQEQQAITDLTRLYWSVINLVTQKIQLFESRPVERVRTELLEMHLYRLKCLQKIILGLDLGSGVEADKLVIDAYEGQHSLYREQHLQLLEHLRFKRGFLTKHEAYVAELLEKIPGTSTESAINAHRDNFPASVQFLQSAVILFKLELLTIGDTVEYDAPVRFSAEAATRLHQLHDTLVMFNELDNIPASHHMGVLDDLHRQLEIQRAALGKMREGVPSREKQHIDDILKILASFEQQTQERLTQLYQALTDNNALSLDPQVFDVEFLPPQTVSQPHPARRKRLIRVNQSGTSVLKLGEQRTLEDGKIVVDVVSSSPQAPSRVNTYASAAAGTWESTTVQQRPATQPSSLAEMTERANTLLSTVPMYLSTAQHNARQNDNPSNILEYLHRHAQALEEQASSFAMQDAAPAQQALVQRLRDASEQLKTEGERLRVQLYKAPGTLDINRLLYLLEHGHVTVHKTSPRAPRGKGKEKNFLEVYTIRDAAGGHRELWEAHFHYATPDTRIDPSSFTGGHLKTLAQSRQGSASQAQAEREGRPHEPIWRARFDSRTARPLFNAVANP